MEKRIMKIPIWKNITISITKVNYGIEFKFPSVLHQLKEIMFNWTRVTAHTLNGDEIHQICIRHPLSNDKYDFITIEYRKWSNFSVRHNLNK